MSAVCLLLEEQEMERQNGKKTTQLFTCVACVCVSAMAAFGHASARMHEADINAVFAGCDTPEFKALVKKISSGMDSELPRRFRKEIGSVPGNHRLLGHCWTFGDAIPKRVMEVIEKKHPGRKNDFIKLWSEFASEVLDDASRASGLPRHRAGALAALIHDVHLLGDRTPDNKLVKDVLSVEEICRNIDKSASSIWGKNDDFTLILRAQMKVVISDRSLAEDERAVKILNFLKLGGCGFHLKPILDTHKFLVAQQNAIMI